MSADRGVSKGATDVLVRKFAPSDVPAVLAILEESPEAAAWSQESLLQLGSGAPTAWVAERDGVVAGFLICRSAADAGAESDQNYWNPLLRFRAKQEARAFIWRCAPRMNLPSHFTNATDSQNAAAVSSTIEIPSRTLFYCRCL